MAQMVVTEIESGSVFLDMAVANTPRAALRRLQESDVLREAKKMLILNSEEADLYLNKARQAFADQVPIGYISPSDGPLAAYIFLLARRPEKIIQQFVSMVASSDRTDFRKAVWVAQYYVEIVPSFTLGPTMMTSAPGSSFRPLRWAGATVVKNIAPVPVAISKASLVSHPSRASA